MSSFNKVVLVGNLVRDPALSYTPSGKPVVNIDLAMNHSYKDKDGNKIEQATFIPVTIWGKQAEATAEYMKKGRQCLIEGALRQEKWVDKKDQKRSRIKVVAENIRFLGQAPKGEQKQSKEPISEEQETPLEHGENIPF